MEKMMHWWISAGMRVLDGYMGMHGLLMWLLWPVFMAFLVAYTAVTTTIMMIYAISMSIFLGLSFREIMTEYLEGVIDPT